MFRRTGIIAALLLSAFVAAQKVTIDPTRLEAVKDFQKLFKKYKEEALQVEAVLTLKGQECPPAVDELLRLMKNPAVQVQQTALLVLESYREQPTFQPLMDSLLSLKDEEQRALIIKVLGAAKMTAALPMLKKTAEVTKSPAVKFELLRAFSHLGDGSVEPMVGTMLSDPDAGVRMTAADCAAVLNLRALGKHVVPLLDDPEWQVQSAAVNAVGKLRPIEAISPLIELMRKPGRIRTECADSLFRITAYEFGVEPDEWATAWASMQKLGWRPPTDEELAKKAEARKKNDVKYGKKLAHNTFAGIQTTSTRVLFIIDVSGSMDDRVVEVEKFPGYADLKKFTVVKKNLIDALDSLTQDTFFDIVAFASDLHVWKGKLVPANIINRDTAKAWVARLNPIGGTEDQELSQAGLLGMVNLSEGKTNTLKALLYSFSIDPDVAQRTTITGLDKNAIKSKLDTVYFLSDGRPSVGKLVDTNEILKEVKRCNDMYRLVIHTIAIGEFEKEFLRSLAAQNGGEFVDLGR
jgi:HEAT repeat protein